MSDLAVFSQRLRNALLDADNLPVEITVRRQKYTVHAPVKAGQQAVVWQVADEFGRKRAAKLAVCGDYEEHSFLSEISYAAKLERNTVFARFESAGIVHLNILDDTDQCFVCFIEQWIDGLTLADFLKQEAAHVTSNFLLAYIRGMCEALNALQAVGLQHNDLHMGNVMLEMPAPGMPADQYAVKVIDTGNLRCVDEPTGIGQGDHRNFVRHLVAIYNTIRRKKLLPVREKRFLDEAEKLFRSMLDEDPSVALTDPEQIRSHFEFAFTRANAPRPARVALQSPFEYISAEHLSDDRLLVSIFADSCPWLHKVSGPDPCIVSGPRGCGKSTMFRWLSIKAHLHKDVMDIADFRIAGFYVSCSTDLQNRFGWIYTEALAAKFKREIVHYFNLLLVREVIQTLCSISDRKDREEFWGLGPAQEQTIYDFVRTAFMLSHPVLQGVSRLRQCLDMVEADLFHCHVQMLKGLNLEWATPETLLGDFTAMLVQEVSFFRDRKITFLIDDFSTHRLPENVQVILLRIIWERRGTHIFKLSSEKYGTALSDSFNATVDVAREMVEIDCGREYVALDDSDQQDKGRSFATDLLANRLKVAEYQSGPELLLGKSEWPHGSLGRALRDKGQGRKNDQYHGIECIASLCSGDISTLLLVYRRIFELGNVQKHTVLTVAKHVQHEAITSVSRELFEAIRNHHPHGPQMHWIVREFGNLTRRILEDGKMLKQGDKTVPPQCPRIEVDQDFDTPDDNLNRHQLDIALELIRRAVFIEMEPGRSRHKFVTTLRWQLRRVYLPAFGAALSKNDAVKWRPAQFKHFLVSPNDACEIEWQKRPKTIPAPESSQTQLPYEENL